MGLSSQPCFNSGLMMFFLRNGKQTEYDCRIVDSSEGYSKHERGVRVARGVIESNTTFSGSSIMRAVLYSK